MKPHKGRLDCWCRHPHGNGYAIIGFHLDHRIYREGHLIETSMVLNHEGDQIETLNSRYTLVGDEQPLWIVVLSAMRVQKPISGTIH